MSWANHLIKRLKEGSTGSLVEEIAAVPKIESGQLCTLILSMERG